jgi:exosortase
MTQHLAYVFFISAGILVFSAPLHQLFVLSLDSELYSHFLLIPIVSLYFFLLDRRAIFHHAKYQPIGLIVVLLSIGIYPIALKLTPPLNVNDFLSLCVFAFVLYINGSFLTIYGVNATKAALFPLLFMAFMIPIPTILLDPFIRFLQVWSAHAVHLAFEILGEPVFRDGMVFQLSGISIEVAKECSGIRSTLALIITGVLAGRIFLRTKRRRVLLCLAIIPAMIVKNAIRITTLTLLAIYIDPSWLTDSWLHRGGGIFFFLIVLMLLAPVLLALHRTEMRSEQQSVR